MKINYELSAYALALKSIEGVGNTKAVALMNNFPTIEEFAKAKPSDFSRVVRSKKLGDEIAGIQSYLVDNWLPGFGNQIDERKRETGIDVVALGDEAYPQKLRETKDPPVVLYIRGNLAALHGARSVAIVGTRSPTKNGVVQAVELSEYLSSQGAIVVSGLAKGIDTAAHQGSIRAKSPGVSVFGTDLETFYPKENQQLAHDLIEQNGALISEIGPDDYSSRGAFVRRDRIQAGLSDVIIPVQSDIDGGTMHTVKFGIDYGRPIFVPMPSDQDKAANIVRGTQNLVMEHNATNFEIDNPRGDDPYGFWHSDVPKKSSQRTFWGESDT